MGFTADQERLGINVVKALAMDGPAKANSGHQGTAMALAPLAHVLFTRVMRYDATAPDWPDRDRFVLSAGHASILQYSFLYLTGYGLTLEDLEQFRQWGSATPGHPEVHVTPGVETTTGPLGQGLANAVGMALAEKLLAQEFNRPGHTVVDHRTWAFLGDGCLMEGISHEACALAGAWKLNKLVALYDDNGISIDGQVKPWYVDDVAKRFDAYQWNVVGPIDGHDVTAVDAAIAQARTSADKPTLIICKTNIGQGSPNRAGTAKAHGEALGADEIALTRAAIGWAHEPFVIPETAYAAWDAKRAGDAAEGKWVKAFAKYKAKHPALAAELARRMSGDLPAGFAQAALLPGATAGTMRPSTTVMVLSILLLDTRPVSVRDTLFSSLMPFLPRK